MNAAFSCPNITASVSTASSIMTDARIAGLLARRETALMKSAEDVRATNLDALIREKARGSVAEFSRLTGKDPTLISRWKSQNQKTRKVISSQTAREIEMALKLPPNWMDHDHAVITARIVERVSLGVPNVTAPRPVLSWGNVDELGEDMLTVPRYRLKVSAGTGAVVFEEEQRDMPDAFRSSHLRERGCDPLQCFVAKVSGDSMEPTLSDGDSILVARNQQTIIDNKIYVVAFDGQIYCKRLFKAGGEIVLRSDNQAYPEIRASAEQVQIIGRVVNASRNL